MFYGPNQRVRRIHQRCRCNPRKRLTERPFGLPDGGQEFASSGGLWADLLNCVHGSPTGGRDFLPLSRQSRSPLVSEQKKRTVEEMDIRGTPPARSLSRCACASTSAMPMSLRAKSSRSGGPSSAGRSREGENRKTRKREKVFRGAWRRRARCASRGRALGSRIAVSDHAALGRGSSRRAREALGPVADT